MTLIRSAFFSCSPHLYSFPQFSFCLFSILLCVFAPLRENFHVLIRFALSHYLLTRMKVSATWKRRVKEGPSVQMKIPGMKQITSGNIRLTGSAMAKALARSRRRSRRSSACRRRAWVMPLPNCSACTKRRDEDRHATRLPSGGTTAVAIPRAFCPPAGPIDRCGTRGPRGDLPSPNRAPARGPHRSPVPLR